MHSLRRVALAIITLCLAFAGTAGAQDTFTKKSLNWNDFVYGVKLNDSKKLTFQCGSLVRVMDASYDLGDNGCGKFAEHMQTLKIADCPKGTVYIPIVKAGQINDQPTPTNVGSQACAWDLNTSPKRVEFTEGGTPIILSKVDRPTHHAHSQQGIYVSKNEGASPEPVVLTRTDTIRLKGRVDTVRATKTDTVVNTTKEVVYTGGRSCWRTGACELGLLGIVAGGYAAYMCATDWCKSRNVIQDNTVVIIHKSVGVMYSVPFNPRP